MTKSHHQEQLPHMQQTPKETLSSTSLLVITVHVVTIAGIIWNQAARAGALETRVAALETMQARQTIAQEKTADSMTALASALEHTQTMVDERTTRVEQRADQNRNALIRQAGRQERLEEQQNAKKPAKSLRNLIVGK